MQSAARCLREGVSTDLALPPLAAVESRGEASCGAEAFLRIVSELSRTREARVDVALATCIPPERISEAGASTVIDGFSDPYGLMGKGGALHWSSKGVEELEREVLKQIQPGTSFGLIIDGIDVVAKRINGVYRLLRRLRESQGVAFVLVRLALGFAEASTQEATSNFRELKQLVDECCVLATCSPTAQQGKERIRFEHRRRLKRAWAEEMVAEWPSQSINFSFRKVTGGERSWESSPEHVKERLEREVGVSLTQKGKGMRPAYEHQGQAGAAQEASRLEEYLPQAAGGHRARVTHLPVSGTPESDEDDEELSWGSGDEDEGQEPEDPLF